MTTPAEAASGSRFVRTACPMDCPDSCSMEAEVADGRVVALRGSRHNPSTDGFMCSKMTAYPKRVHGPDRVRAPLRRAGAKGSGAFVPVAWPEALDEIAATLDRIRRAHGGEAILPYHYDGSNGVFAHDSVDEALWRSLGASVLERTLCAAPATACATAVYGKMAGVAFEDYALADLIVVWGGNPGVTNIHLVPALNAAKARGARLVVVDPRRTRLAERADLHLPIRPGADMALALWLAGEIDRRGAVDAAFLARHAKNSDRIRAKARAWTLARAAAAAGLDPQSMLRLADLYLAASPAVIRIGWGLERNRNGDGAMTAILALPALAGKFGVRGGGYTLSNSGAFRTRGEDMVGVPQASPPPRSINMVRLSEALDPALRPPVKALFVYDSNPMVSTPDTAGVRRGLLRDDLFTVVHEQVMTDTCAFADFVLPAPTFLEQHELHRSYGTMVLQRIDPAIAPVCDSMPNEALFAALAGRLGVSGPAFDPDPAALGAKYLAACKAAPADAAGTMRRTGVVPMDFDGDPRPIQFKTVFPPTPDGRADLDPEVWRAQGRDVFDFAPDPATPAYPLAMLSPATARTINSSLGELDRTPLSCALATGDAEARGVRDGDLVRVFNALGEIRAHAKIDAGLRPGTCVVPKGVWSKNCPGGAGANALIAAATTPISGGATYNDARVQVARA